jgi:malonyl-CoA/methylmalonyl-CoA synthetase
MVDLHSAYAATLGRAPHRTLLELPNGRVFTWATLERLSAQIANVLVVSGVRPGDRVASQIEKSPQGIALYLACLRVGAIYLPLNTAYQQREIVHILGDARPSMIIGDPAYVPTLSKCAAPSATLLELSARGTGSLLEQAAQALDVFESPDWGEGHTACILYTSGTTGQPKGAMLTHGNLLSNARALQAAWEVSPADVLLHALPLFHAHGLFVAVNTIFLTGGSMILLPKFEPDEVVRLLPRATLMMGVPTFYSRLLRHPGLTRESCAHVRVFISGSAPLLPEIFGEFYRRTGHTILERYGMTETLITTSNPLRGPRVAASVGLPLPGVEVRLADQKGGPLAAGEVGMVEVRGPNVFTGYWQAPEKTAAEFRADGFFITRDLGFFDSTGYLHLVGRSTDLIISGGYNVYPREVETVIETIAGVSECAIIGVPHPDFGEAVVAFVLRSTEAAAAGPDEVEVKSRVRAELAAYKVPKAVLFVDALPRNTLGKVQRNRLRQTYGRLFL